MPRGCVGGAVALRRTRKRSPTVGKVVLGAFCASLAAVAGRAEADEISRNLTQQGLQAIEAGSLGQALRLLQDATRADPADADAHFALGAALNRAGRSEDAVLALARARDLGGKQPDLPLEMGAALLGIGQYARARDELEAYEKANPGRAATSEMLARAYAGLGDYARAEALLEEAERRDRTLAPAVRYQRAVLAEHQGRRQEAARHLDSILLDFPDSSLAQTLRERLAAAAPPGDGKRWRVVTSFSVGYNDNVIALGDGQPLPTGISDESSAFGRLTLQGEYDLWLRRGESLTVGYGGVFDRYVELDDLRSDDHFVSLDWRRSLNEQVSAALRSGIGVTQVGGEKLRQYVTTRAALGWRVLPNLTIEPALALTGSDYNRIGFLAAEDDRDGRSVTGTLLGYFSVPALELTGRAGGFYVDADTDGSNFDAHSYGLSLALQRPLPWELSATLEYTRAWTDFQNPDTRATPALGFKREDDAHIVGLQLSRPVHERASVFVRFDYVENDSNIDVFEYDQATASAGVVVRF